MTTWLLDTGPIVAYLDSSDDAHTRVATLWDKLTGRFVTTDAVIVEAMHFVGRVAGGPSALADLVQASSVEVFDLCQPAELREAALLMAQYEDTPMDFADATLLLLAEALEVEDVLTLDRRGFATFRTRRGRALRNALDLA